MDTDNFQRSRLHCIKIARDLLKAEGYFVDILWHTDDIRTICEQRGWPILSKAECMEIFYQLRRHFDGEHGLSWPQLENIVWRYLTRRGLIRE